MLQRAHSLETYGVDPHPCKVTLVENVHVPPRLAVRPGAVDINLVPLIKLMQISFVMLAQFIPHASVIYPDYCCIPKPLSKELTPC